MVSLLPGCFMLLGAPWNQIQTTTTTTLQHPESKLLNRWTWVPSDVWRTQRERFPAHPWWSGRGQGEKIRASLWYEITVIRLVRRVLPLRGCNTDVGSSSRDRQTAAPAAPEEPPIGSPPSSRYSHVPVSAEHFRCLKTPACSEGKTSWPHRTRVWHFVPVPVERGSSRRGEPASLGRGAVELPAVLSAHAVLQGEEAQLRPLSAMETVTFLSQCRTGGNIDNAFTYVSPTVK